MQCAFHIESSHVVPRAAQRAEQGPAEVEDIHDPLIIAQIVAYMEEHNECIYKLQHLRDIYREKVAELGKPCKETWKPHHS